MLLSREYDGVYIGRLTIQAKQKPSFREKNACQERRGGVEYDKN
jgi:hypothetical protein